MPCPTLRLQDSMPIIALGIAYTIMSPALAGRATSGFAPLLLVRQFDVVIPRDRHWQSYLVKVTSFQDLISEDFHVVDASYSCEQQGVSGSGHVVSCSSVLFNDASLATPTALAAGLIFACTGNARNGHTSFQ